MIMKRQETQEKNKKTKLNKRVFKGGANTMHGKERNINEKRVTEDCKEICIVI
jgi:hypothetical protein